MPLCTQEVRWFFEGALADTGAGIEEWFGTHRVGGRSRADALRWSPDPPAWRGDRYLVVPGADDLGVKWREGQLQIKGRTAVLGARRFACDIEGMVERWVKWSYSGRAVDRRFGSCFAPGVTPADPVLVEKRRLQRTLRLEPSGALVEVPAEEPGARGMGIELTRIRLQGGPRDTHWSIGVEAYPGDPAMETAFALAVADLLRGCPALPLTRAPSLSYPGWLTRLSRGAGAAPGHDRI